MIIRKSSLTGKAVWIGRFLTKGAARSAYCRACKRELERVRRWNEKLARRRAKILCLLNCCLDKIGFTQQLTPEQLAAARQLNKIADEKICCDMHFYEHIVEDHRRRDEIHKFRQREREGKCL